MITNCPNCNAIYEIDSKILGEKGKKVKCSSCGHIWLQTVEKAPVLSSIPLPPLNHQIEENLELDTLNELKSINKSHLFKLLSLVFVMVLIGALLVVVKQKDVDFVKRFDTAFKTPPKFQQSNLTIKDDKVSIIKDEEGVIVLVSATVENNTQFKEDVKPMEVSLIDDKGVVVAKKETTSLKQSIMPKEKTLIMARFFNIENNKIKEYEIKRVE